MQIEIVKTLLYIIKRMLYKSLNSKTVRHFYIYSFFSSFLLFLPVLLMIYKVRNVTAGDMLIIEAFYYFSIFLFEIPTGILGDKIGHDKLVVMGLMGTILSYVLFSYSYKLELIIISQVLLGIFTSCISGSDHSSLYVYFEKLEEKNNEKYQDKIYRISVLSMLLSFILSGVVFKLDSRGVLTFMLTALSYSIATVFYVLFVINKGNEVKGKEEKGAVIPETPELKSCIYFDKDVIICGAIIGIMSGSYVISQIFYNNLRIGPYTIGILYCVGNASQFIFNKFKFKFNRLLMFLIPLIYIITIIENTVAVILFVFLVALINSKVKPFINNYVLAHSKTHKAYNMSLMSLVYNIINVLLMVSLSGIIHLIGYKHSMLVLTAVTLILLLYIYIKSSEKYKMEINRSIV